MPIGFFSSRWLVHRLPLPGSRLVDSGFLNPSLLMMTRLKEVGSGK